MQSQLETAKWEHSSRRQAMETATCKCEIAGDRLASEETAEWAWQKTG